MMTDDLQKYVKEKKQTGVVPFQMNGKHLR